MKCEKRTYHQGRTTFMLLMDFQSHNQIVRKLLGCGTVQFERVLNHLLCPIIHHTKSVLVFRSPVASGYGWIKLGQKIFIPVGQNAVLYSYKFN